MLGLEGHARDELPAEAGARRGLARARFGWRAESGVRVHDVEPVHLRQLHILQFLHRFVGVGGQDGLQLLCAPKSKQG